MLFASKNVIRFFISLAQKCHSEIELGCWNDWACPVIHIFWKDIHRTLEAILNIKIPFQFYVFYLEVWICMKPIIHTYGEYFWLQLKKALTRKWLQAASPTIEDWKVIIIETYQMEVLTFSFKLKNKQKGALLWKKDGRNLWKIEK